MNTAKLLCAAIVGGLLSLCSQAGALTNLPFGQVATGALTTAPEINYYSFAANAGDVVDLTLVTTSGSLSPSLQLVNSTGTVIATANTNPSFCGSAGTELNSATLATAGTYTVEVSDCSSTNTGDYALYVQRVNNPTGAVSFTFGSTQSGTISSAAQSNSYTFSASAGDVVDFIAHSTGTNTLSPKIRLYSSTGAAVASANTNQSFCGSPDVEMISGTLPTTGMYTVLVGDCADSNTGNYNLYLQRTNNPTAATSLSFGATDSGAIASEAQSNTFTFSASTGDVVNFTAHSTSGSLSPKIVLYNPSGALVSSANSNQSFCGNADAELNAVTLPTTGTYTVLVGDCSDSNTGNYDLYSQRTDNPGGSVAVPFGQVQSGSIASVAQSITYTFSATANDAVAITVHSTSGTLSPKILLYNPSGMLVSSVNTNQSFCGNADAEMSAVALPATGTYTVLIGDCSDSNTGNFNIYAQRTNNPSGSVGVTYGQVQNGSITAATQSSTFTFSGSAGDVVDFTAHSTSGTLSPKILLYNTTGLLNSSANANQSFCGNADVELNVIKLPATGTYTVLVGDCDDTNSGNFNFYLQSTNNPGGAASVLWGQTQTSNIGSVAYSDAWTFAGENGEAINLTTVATSGTLSPKIQVYNPDGTLLASNNTNQSFCGGAKATLTSVALTQNGGYTVLVGDCDDLNTGNYSLQSQCFTNCALPAPTLSSISPHSALASTAGFTLAVTGTNFVNVDANSVVEWNNVPLSTTWVSTTQMTAAVPAANIAVAGADSVTVFTPTPGGGTSSAASFTVNNPLPVLTSLSPTNVTFGSPSFTLTLNGSGFVTTSTAQWNGSNLATTFVSATQLKATVPAGELTGSCTASVTVVNTTPGGGTSAALTFAINIATPTLTAISPASTPFGGSGFTLTATGSCFVSTSTVDWNGAALTTTYVSATKLKAAVVSADLAHAGSAAVTVANPSPGGGTTSSELTFTITKVKPVITWATPAPITYGATVTTVQEDATANVPGTFSYSQPLGWKPKAGTHTITVTFTPTDTTDYTTATASVTLTVEQASPAITWATPAPITYGTALSTTQQNATSTVAGTFAYSPVSGTFPAAGNQTLTATLTPTDTTDYTIATATVTLVVNKVPLTVTASSMSRVYGIANPTFTDTFTGFVNGDTQSVVSGTASLTTTATTTSTVGTYPITAALGTLSAANYTFSFVNGTLTVTQATPAIAWPTPSAITYGRALSATQLDASSKVAGTLVYSPAAGTVLTAGTQTLSVTLTPTDTTDYVTGTATVTLTVNKAKPVITWPAPAPITYGTAVGPTQQNATANVAGTLAYTPNAGWIPIAGTHTMTATFTPTDTVDYVASTTGTVTLTVNPATLTVTAQNVQRDYGAANPAFTDTITGFVNKDTETVVSGAASLTTTATTTSPVGAYPITATLGTLSAANYTFNFVSGMLTVTQATPVITWVAPAAIAYGTALSATQLDAGSKVAGTFVYSPAVGTVLTAGAQTLSVTLTPTNTTDYTMATANVTLTVKKATPVITWLTPAPITYGTAVGPTQQDATASVPGTFSYYPAAGWKPTVGTHTMTVTFTPTDTTDYKTATTSVTLTVNPAT